MVVVWNSPPAAGRILSLSSSVNYHHSLSPDPFPPTVKLGQHLGMLDHLIPAEYVQTMRRHMLNRCPVSSWADVQQTITEDLGAPPTELFARFSPEPLASASLAQVHEAETRDGTRLAVKV